MIAALLFSAPDAQAVPFSLETKLVASDATFDYEFGYSVAVSGTTALVGSWADWSAGFDVGSAYLLDASTGMQMAKLTAADAGPRHNFGFSVALSETTALVGALGDDDRRGAAYLYDIATATQIAKLKAADAAVDDQFGWSAALLETTALIGAPDDDDGGDSSGSAYLFDTTTGSQIAKLTAADAAAGDRFGISVALSGTTALVGAPSDDDGGNDSGSAYLFDITTGTQIAKLTAADAAAFDSFGISVALSGTTALVGAWGGDIKNGSAYLFDITTGTQIAKLTAANVRPGDYFGTSVALSGTTALVGAPFGANRRGSAHVFDATTGTQVARPTAADGVPGDLFGWSVALSGTTALVGARWSDARAGSAYLYTTPAAPVPLPAGAWLLLSGLAALGVARRARG